MSTITMEIGGLRFATTLSGAAGRTAAALLARLPVEDRIVHGRWSGPLCLLRRINLGVPLEHPVMMLSAGDIVYHPAHFDIAIVYGTTQFIEMTGPVAVTHLGRLSGDLAALAGLGESVQARGATTIVITR